MSGAGSLTPEQRLVVSAPCRDLLVSAAAGSGKTRVLTERIVDRIRRGEAEMDRILVVTFTEAAAASMRVRLEAALREAVEPTLPQEARQRIRRALACLPDAAVSTLHAFCLDLVRTYPQALVDGDGQPLVDPSFRVADAGEAGILRADALDAVLVAHYEAEEKQIREEAGRTLAGAESDFLRMADAFGNARGDAGLRSMLQALHEDLRSLPDYPEYLSRSLARMEAAARSFPDSPHAARFLLRLRLLVRQALPPARILRSRLVSGEVRLTAKSKPAGEMEGAFLDAFDALERLESLLAEGLPADPASGPPPGLWQEALSVAAGCPVLSMPRQDPRIPGRSEFVGTMHMGVAEALYAVNGSFGSETARKEFRQEPIRLLRPAAAIEAEIALASPILSRFLGLQAELDAAYRQAKRDAGVVDFADFEHLALAALRHPEVREDLRHRYREIYVDEYQDTSAIQEALLRQVSSDNLFRVGDVKQSIYRFRHARPDLFLETLSHALSDPSGGRLFLLNRNFRSVPGILEAVNQVFSQLMSPEAGEIAYDETHRLAAAREAGPVPSPAGVRMRLPLPRIPPDSGGAAAASVPAEPETAGSGTESQGDLPEPEGEDADRREREGDRLAADILDMAREEGVPFRDMVVLTRTRAAGTALGFRLANAGVPIHQDPSDSLLDSPDVQLFEALLHLLDNTRQDIPLATVMRSRLLSDPFQPEDLLRIRALDRRNGRPARFFHEAVFRLAEGLPAEDPDPGLGDRVRRFLGTLAELRERAAHLAAHELIRAVDESARWTDFVRLQPDGERRAADLLAFQSFAERTESVRRRGVSGFARLLRSIRDRQVGAPEAGPREPAGDAVRIMTLHASKGLEFPVVFLAALDTPFHFPDLNRAVLMDETLGIGVDPVDSTGRFRVASPIRLTIAEKKRIEMMAEELRLLYVGMTRARDRLVLSAFPDWDGKRKGSGKALLRRLSDCLGEQAEGLPAHRVLAAGSPLEWLLMALVRTPDFAPLGLLLPGWQAESLPVPHRSAPPRVAVDPWDPDDPGLPGSTASPRDRPRPERIPGYEAGQVRRWLQEPLDETLQAAVDGLRARFGWTYPYRSASQAPYKVSVSELKRRGARDPAGAPDPDSLPDGVSAQAESHGGRPSIRIPVSPLQNIDLALRPIPAPGPSPEPAAREDGDSASAGTAVHAVLRYLEPGEWDSLRSPEALRARVRAMVDALLLDESEAESVEPFLEDLLAFFRSPLSGRMAAAHRGSGLHRETPFTLALPGESVFPGCAGPSCGFAPGDRVLVQGILDAWFREGDGIVLVDYKTDRVPGGDGALSDPVRTRHGRQMSLYARAVSAATGLPVTACLVWLVRHRTAVDLAQDLETGMGFASGIW